MSSMQLAFSRWLVPAVLATAAVLLSACDAKAPEPQADLRITGVTVIDAERGRRDNQTVLIRGEQIIAAGSGDDRSATRTVDGTGKFLIPGLWDMHVHITYVPELTPMMADLFLDYGITSVRDTGALLHEIQPEIETWRAEGAVAPSIYFSGPLLDGALVVYDGDGRSEIGIANPTPDAARQNIARLQSAGVDFVKIYELVSPDVFAAMVQAARAAGLPIASHVPLALLAGDAGPQVDSMEHLRNIEMACADNANELLAQRRARIEQPGTDSGAALRAELHRAHRSPARARADEQTCNDVMAALSDTIQVPTLRLNTVGLYPPQARTDWMTHLAKLPQQTQDAWLAFAENFPAPGSDALTELQQFSQWSLDLIGKLHAAGVPVGAGTDTPIGSAIPGYSLHTELERLVQAGLTPLDALAAATVRPPEFFDMADTIGQVKAGHVADLLLLNADPLADIRNTREISAVISRGKLVREY